MKRGETTNLLKKKKNKKTHRGEKVTNDKVSPQNEKSERWADEKRFISAVKSRSFAPLRHSSYL